MGVYVVSVVVGVVFVLAGLSLVVLALLMLFGVWAGVLAVGAALIASGLLVPWEELTSAKSASTSPRR